VNRTLARRYLAGGSPVGRRVRLGFEGDSPWLTVVGVIGDIRHSSLTDDPDPELHVPLAQAPTSTMMLAIRSDTRVEDLAASVRQEIASIDAALPAYHVKPLEGLVRDSMLPRTTSTALMLLFSAVALVLAAVGTYGVIAYGVSQQAREFAVRVVLGATRREVVGLVLRQGLGMAGVGIALGVAGALGGSRLLSKALYGVSPADPLTYVAVAALLVATALVACGLPAWRASATAPATALRADSR
jgi:ABC-type antimicrobial peptide transport system permease subunit